MLDLKMLRADPETVRKGIAAKGETADLDRWLEMDEERRAALLEWENGRAELNRAGPLIAAAKKEGRDASEAIANMKAVKARGQELKARIDTLDGEMEAILIRVPNLPAADVPVGPDETGNVEVDLWGEKRELDFEPKAHWDLGKDLDILDLEAGGKVGGSGFPILKGAGARLERALIQFMLDLHTEEHGYREVSAPYLARPETMVTCGQIPKLEEDMYRCRDDELYLIPTAEVPLTNLHRDEILDGARLPLRYVGHTPCFRREAGAAGRDTRGLIRVHQFHKVELVTFAEEGKSDEELNKLRGHAEEVLRRLGLHYRTLLLCTGDMSFAGRRTYDLEVWAPGVGKYLEVSSCTVFGDFQARRANTRYRDGDGKLRIAHTMNGSGLALPRTVIAIMETYQRADGTIDVPEALVPYMGGRTRIGGGEESE
ncbi:MAG: serine--tRNA ligase [Planctomycetota bacterium]